MTSPRKTNGNGNGHVTYREVRQIVDAAEVKMSSVTDRLAERINAIDEHGSRGVVVLQDRVKDNAEAITRLEAKVSSLELSRAEGKGRTTIIAAIVSAAVTLAIGVILALVPRASNDPTPTSTPTITVTLPAPSITATVTATPESRIVAGGAGEPREPSEPEPEPSASASPTIRPTSPPMIPSLPPQARAILGAIRGFLCGVLPTCRG